jgi:hypothetical protein
MARICIQHTTRQSGPLFAGLPFAEPLLAPTIPTLYFQCQLTTR